jgi:hypothetical protein
MICVVRAKKDENGRVLVDDEIEIEFTGGSKTKLFGQPAQHFWDAMDKAVGKSPTRRDLEQGR